MTRSLLPATVARRLCHRCGKRRGHATWNICADGNRNRVVCAECDIALNRLVLRWLGKPDYRQKINAYEAKTRLAILAHEMVKS